MASTRKIVVQSASSSWNSFQHTDTWDIERSEQWQRLTIAPREHPTKLLLELSHCLSEPFGIRYILLRPQTKRKPGRYTSAHPCCRSSMQNFFTHFADFLEHDGRHHIWLQSIKQAAVLIYDNHNLLFGYGPLDQFVAVLNRHGLRFDSVQFPQPHKHCVHRKFDQAEKDILSYWEWRYSPFQSSGDST